MVKVNRLVSDEPFKFLRGDSFKILSDISMIGITKTEIARSHFGSGIIEIRLLHRILCQFTNNLLNFLDSQLFLPFCLYCSCIAAPTPFSKDEITNRTSAYRVWRTLSLLSRHSISRYSFAFSLNTALYIRSVTCAYL